MTRTTPRDSRHCEGCGAPIRGRQGKKHCNARCRAVASRLKQRARAEAILTIVKDRIAELEDLLGQD